MILGLVNFKMIRDWDGHRDYEATYLVQDFEDISQLPLPGSCLSLHKHQDIHALHFITSEAKQVPDLSPRHVIITAIYSTRDPMIRGVVRMWDMQDLIV